MLLKAVKKINFFHFKCLSTRKELRIMNPEKKCTGTRESTCITVQRILRLAAKLAFREAVINNRCLVKRLVDHEFST